MVQVLNYGIRGIWYGFLMNAGISSALSTIFLVTTSFDEQIQQVKNRLHIESQFENQ
jgi:hypothetical protein